MVLIGTVVKVIDAYNVTVRLVDIHKTKTHTPDDELPEAVVCTPPGVMPEIKSGDSVIVAFDKNNFNSPVVIGKLFTEKNNKSQSSAKFSELTVSTKCSLPSDIKIGDVTYKQLETLLNNSENVSTTFSNLKTRMKDVEAHVSNDSKHFSGSLKSVEKITVTSDMYGDASKRSSLSPVEGQLFFLLEE